MAVSKNTPMVVAANEIQRAKPKFENLNAAVGRPLVFEQEARFALQHVERNPEIAKCDPSTVRHSFENLALMGLSLNPQTQEVALIPRWNSKKGMLDCTASPMYRGLVKLAVQAGGVTSVQASPVYESDEFSVTMGTSPELVHSPKSLWAGMDARIIDLKDLTRNKMIAAYCVATTPAGEKLITIMGLEEILRVANASESFNPRPKRNGKPTPKPSGPWLSWPEEMTVKSILRRAQKTWPPGTNTVYQRALDAAISAQTEADVNDQVAPHSERGGDQEENGEQTLVLSKDQIKDLRSLCQRSKTAVAAVCNAYSVQKLDDIPSELFDEIRLKLIQKRDRLKAGGGDE